MEDLPELAGIADDLKQRRILAAVLLAFGFIGALLAVLIGELLVVIGGAVVFGIMIYGGIRIVLDTERRLAEVQRAIEHGEVVQATVTEPAPTNTGKTACTLTWPMAGATGKTDAELVGTWSQNDTISVLVADAGDAILIPLVHGIELSIRD